MNLRSHIHQLTRSHLTTGPDGKPATRPALLVELQHAVKPGNDGTGGGSASKPLPINADADTQKPPTGGFPISKGVTK